MTYNKQKRLLTMPEVETYLTKKDPTLEDWMEFNGELFSRLNGESEETTVPQYAHFTDVDQHAARACMTTEEYFDQVQERVGSLARGVLRLVHSEMDDAWHIKVEVQEEVQDL
jgi:hypothetical protein